MSAKPSPITILQDTREQCPWRFSNDCTVQVVTLTEGDYSMAGFSDRVRVERKSLADLVGSITVGREKFLDECRRLTAFEFRFLVVESSLLVADEPTERPKVRDWLAR